MRTLSRMGFAAVAAGALAIGAAVPAAAEPGDHPNNADQVSQFIAGINSNSQDASDFAPASLMVQVTHYDKNNDNGCGTPSAGPPPCAPAVPGAPPETDELAFDKDLKLTTTKLPKCDHTASYDLDGDGPGEAIPFSSMTTDQAIAACAKAQVGSGTAIARLPGFPSENSEATETVTAFNGNTSTGLGGFQAGNPTILLHVDDDAGNPTVILQGQIRNDTVPDTSAPGGGVSSDEFGKELHIPNVPDLGSDFASLVLTNAVVSKKYSFKKNGKKVTKNYVTARCADDVVDTDGAGGPPGGAGNSDTLDTDGEWDFDAYWTYQTPDFPPGPPDTSVVTEDQYRHVQECAQK